MKDQNMIVLLKEEKVERKELIITKRRIPMIRDYLRGDNARKYVNVINRMIYFYRNFETRFAIKKGDVFIAYFEFQCGNEINGPHFVVALLDSSPLSQIATIIPLHSAKEGKELNPASEIYLGEIPGVANGKEAVAIINQIRTIDKRRLFDKAAIEHFNQYAKGENFADYVNITAQHKFIYRLSDEQYRRMHTAVQQFVFNGYIKHNK